ncbi:DUF1687-domain-containing protein [Xylariaceae sp. FL0016]|nr:DUF1687-domain-containing protein [Xylariaceae sp. FL0016]
MFRFNKPKDIIQLFHKPSSPASLRVATLLKQVSANASESATEDQASDHSHQTNPLKQRQEFELHITEEPPTSDQLKTILEYAGQSRISSIIQGTSTEAEALKKFRENADSLSRPLVVDWHKGHVVASEKESEILKMLEEKSKGN